MIGPDRRVLVFSAHAADFCSRAGGTIARFADAGSQVQVWDMSYGEKCESPALWASRDEPDPDSIRACRHAEIQAASRALGCAADCFDFGDCPLVIDQERQFLVLDAVRAFRPDLVLTHWRDDFLHPDHARPPAPPSGPAATAMPPADPPRTLPARAPRSSTTSASWAAPRQSPSRPSCMSMSRPSSSANSKPCGIWPPSPSCPGGTRPWPGTEPSRPRPPGGWPASMPRDSSASALRRFGDGASDRAGCARWRGAPPGRCAPGPPAIA